MKTEQLEIINKLGLHIRASNVLVNTAQRFSSRIYLFIGEKKADAKSIMDLMLIGASMGATLTLEVDGDDEESAFEAIKSLINNRFGESE
jgi:phosphocarrier protein HPr